MNPEVPYFMSRNTPASSSQTLHFQKRCRLSLETVHLQKCSSPTMSGTQKGRLLTAEHAFPSLPKCPHVIFRNAPSSEELCVSSPETSSFCLQKCHISFLKARHLWERLSSCLEMPGAHPQSLPIGPRRRRNSGTHFLPDLPGRGWAMTRQPCSPTSSPVPVAPWDLSATCRACSVPGARIK